MTDQSTCQRCKSPIAGKRFALRVESEEPGPRTMELTVCEECLRSLERWLVRRGRRQDAAESDSPDLETPRSSSKKKRQRSRSSSPYENELDRHSRMIRFRRIALIAGTVLGVCGLFGLLVIMITRKH